MYDTYDEDDDIYDADANLYDDPLLPKPTCQRCEGAGIIIGGDGQYECPKCGGTGVDNG